MPSLLGPERSVRLFVHRGHRGPWSQWAIVWSGGLHGLMFALAGWATRGEYQRPFPMASEQVARAYAIHYLVLAGPPIRPQPRPERQLVRRPAPVATAMVPETPPSLPAVTDARTRGEPHPSVLQVEELSPRTIAGIGQVIPTPSSDSVPGRKLARTVGPTVPGPREVALVRREPDRVAELVSGAGSVCPELWRPATWANREIAVAVAFVVDTNGSVDPETLRVIESPNRPQTENRVHSHIYIVGATVRDDRNRLDPAAYDSLVTHEVASHVADLLFRPALSEGRAIRSTVLVSCQSS